ncbi:MAG: HlyD family efflux transporter periplasmic adaptor subunit [Peptostreptococcaceae bacterium]|nr:HlyD family efflux transporter periplasmic adaptor subunit [Peptostreptococcaceae bacterium]
MKKQIKLILFSCLALFIILTVVYQKNRPLEVSASIISRGSLIDSFREEGLVSSKDEHTLYVPYDGKIQMILEPGTRVKKGDVILTMDDEMLQVQKDQLLSQIRSIQGQQDMSLSAVTDDQIEIARIAVDSSKINLENAQKNYDRLRSLFDLGGVSKTELEAVENLFINAQHDVAVKEKQLRELKNNRIEKPGSKKFYSGQISALQAQLDDIQNKLERSDVVAPIDGMIKYSAGRSGAYAQAIHPVMEIAPLDDLIVTSNVLTKNIPALKIDQEVLVVQKTYAGDLEYVAKIIHIDEFAHKNISSLGLDEQRVQVKLKLLDKNPLRDGYGVDVVFDTFRKENVLIIDKTSYFDDGDKNYVWKIDGQRLVRSEITLGYVGAYEAEVLKGLNENDRIVSDPNNSNFKDGVRVKILT